MKTPEDAEIIGVDDILSARSLETGRSSVRHCFKRPGTSRFATLPVIANLSVMAEIDGPFCRFAICSVAAVDTASLTPLAPYLVIGEEPWATPDFCNIGRPLTFEMSPGILGVSEGFSAQGFPIEGVFGLDETKPCTWQVCGVPTIVLYCVPNCHSVAMPLPDHSMDHCSMYSMISINLHCGALYSQTQLRRRYFYLRVETSTSD